MQASTIARHTLRICWNDAPPTENCTYKLTAPDRFHLRFKLVPGRKGGSSHGKARHISVEGALRVRAAQLLYLSAQENKKMAHQIPREDAANVGGSWSLGVFRKGSSRVRIKQPVARLVAHAHPWASTTNRVLMDLSIV